MLCSSASYRTVFPLISESFQGLLVGAKDVSVLHGFFSLRSVDLICCYFHHFTTRLFFIFCVLLYLTIFKLKQKIIIFLTHNDQFPKSDFFFLENSKSPDVMF